MGKIVAKLRRAVTFLDRNPRRAEKDRPKRAMQMAERSDRSTVAGALARAFLVVVLAVFPAMAIPSTAPDTAQSMVLLALFTGGIVFAEYSSAYPALIEFRFAAPFNRTRFALVSIMALALSLLQRNLVEPGLLGAFFTDLAAICGAMLDFSFSPVHLLVASLPDAVPAEHLIRVRDGAALAFTLGVTTVAGFALALKMNVWPMGHGPFNVWLNLPTFDPTAGNDVVLRLQRHARINVALGIFMPFLLPGAVVASALLIKPLTLTSPMGYVWGITIWAFLPVALVMRGAAMARVARMIRSSRRRLADSDGTSLLVA